ncbi:SPOR domain-containing protein [Wenzhouxiangella sp. EGI_FJ10409]|uniref:SPOR domain-containing protein n=1 Tax=Wenzhouxiangella sp. EGI_FJ10409 TaxID=3243767 RepID=UPI0035D96467
MDKVLKQRLVGASILIALAVIFLPMLFDGDEDDAVERRELSLDAPERESGERRVRRLALDPDQARQPPGESRAEPLDDSASESERPGDDARTRPEPQQEREREVAPLEPEPVEPESGPEIAPETESEPEREGETAESTTSDEADSRDDSADSSSTEAPESTPEAPEASTDGRWIVQVAVFGNRETADSIRQRLVDLGHRARMDVLVRDQTELYRLRTGPYDDEAVAEQARGQIVATVAGVEPEVRERSDESGSDDREGLSVQVGSFASRNNAERLVEQLTGAGYDAFMHAEESGGRTIWRVRVGSHEERADAERLLETLSEEQGLKGIVVSHP